MLKWKLSLLKIYYKLSSMIAVSRLSKKNVILLFFSYHFFKNVQCFRLVVDVDIDIVFLVGVLWHWDDECVEWEKCETLAICFICTHPMIVANEQKLLVHIMVIHLSSVQIVVTSTLTSDSNSTRNQMTPKGNTKKNTNTSTFTTITQHKRVINYKSLLFYWLLFGSGSWYCRNIIKWKYPLSKLWKEKANGNKFVGTHSKTIWVMHTHTHTPVMIKYRNENVWSFYFGAVLAYRYRRI